VVPQEELDRARNVGLVGALENLVSQHKMKSDRFARAPITHPTGASKLTGYAVVQLPHAVTSDLVQSCMAADNHAGKDGAVVTGNDCHNNSLTG
jgi:hypothetical protein